MKLPRRSTDTKSELRLSSKRSPSACHRRPPRCCPFLHGEHGLLHRFHPGTTAAAAPHQMPIAESFQLRKHAITREATLTSGWR